MLMSVKSACAAEMLLKKKHSVFKRLPVVYFLGGQPCILADNSLACHCTCFSTRESTDMAVVGELEALSSITAQQGMRA